MAQMKISEVVSIAMAGVALVISGLTSYYVSQQVRLMGGQIRSYVQVVEAKLVEPVTDASYIRIQLRIKNFGQTAASEVYGDMEYSLDRPDSQGKGNEATRREIGPMAPGLERTFTLKSDRLNHRDWRTPQPRNYQSMFFFGTIWFTDATTHEEQKQDWCYELALKGESDLKRTDLDACDVLTYSSKKNR
jgi:hypothetical protein